MLLGPKVVVICPSCNVMGSHEPLLSGNTFDGTYYTDGQAVFPMLPPNPTIVQCPGCRRPYWLSLATEFKLGGLGPFEMVETHIQGSPVKQHFSDVPKLAEPTEYEYLSGIDDLIKAKPNAALMVRLMAWWRGNDRYRLQTLKHALENASPSTPQLAAMRRANIDALLNLLPDVDENDPLKPLLRAEIFRQIGKFDRALELLARPYPDEYAGVIKRLSALCRDKDTVLRTL